jgi:hypothetical protein
MHETTKQKTVVTRVSPALAAELEAAAERELLPVATYLRRLIAQAVSADRRVAA